MGYMNHADAQSFATNSTDTVSPPNVLGQNEPSSRERSGELWTRNSPDYSYPEPYERCGDNSEVHAPVAVEVPTAEIIP